MRNSVGFDEVGEGVAFGHHFAGVVPRVAELAAAADVGVGDDDAAVEQRETCRAEAEWECVAVGAVAVDVERRLAVVVEFVSAVDEGDGHLRAVVRGEPEALEA